MTEIKIEELNELTSRIRTIEEMKTKLQAMYSPVHSPHLDAPRATHYGNVTETATFKIIEFKEQYAAACDSVLAELVQIESWLSELPPEIQALIRNRYILGKSWAETCRDVYGRRNDHFYARNVLIRFLKHRAGGNCSN